MNIVYLIGNGFDIAQKYPTSYQEFYNWLANRPPVNDLQKKMLDDIQCDKTQNWSDMEIALGEFSLQTEDKEMFENFYLHIIKELKTYLCSIDDSFKMNEFIQKKYFRDIVTPEFYLTNREQTEFKKFYYDHRNETRYIDVVSFNYTGIFEKTFEGAQASNALPSCSYPYQFNGVIKVHGTCNSTILMGVDNQQQIKNPLFAKDEDVHDYFIKPKINLQLGFMQDEIATRIINNAHLIVTMGISFGDTDYTWWKIIGKHLKESPNTKIIINHFSKENLPSSLLEPRKKRHVKDFFLSKCGLDNDNIKLFSNNVYIAVNKGFLQPDYYIVDDENRKGQ